MRPVRIPNLEHDAATSHAAMLLASADPAAVRSRERTNAVPLKLNGANSAVRARRQSGAALRKRPSPSRRSELSRPLRERFARPRPPREARAGLEGVEETRPVEIAPGAHRGEASVPTPLIVGARRRVRAAVITSHVAYALGWRKASAGSAQRKRIGPPWMWVALNVLAILFVAQACVLSAVDSSAINTAVAPLFQAFTGAKPDSFDVGGPAPRAVNTPAAFIATMLPYARHASQTLHWPVSMILAQWGVEHGWKLPDFDGWNVGNTKAFNSPTGVCYGAPVVRDFCAPKTPGAGLAIYIHGAQLHYYSGIATAARQGGPNAAARALGQSPWDAGHYTVDNSPGDTLLRAMQAFNLYRYDTP